MVMALNIKLEVRPNKFYDSKKSKCSKDRQTKTSFCNSIVVAKEKFKAPVIQKSVEVDAIILNLPQTDNDTVKDIEPIVKILHCTKCSNFQNHFNWENATEN